MRLIWTIFLLLPIILMARENPFASASESQVVVPTKEPLAVEKTRTQTKPKIHPRRINTTETATQSINKPKVHPQRQVKQITQTQSKPKIHPQRNLGKKEVLNFSKARFVFRENSAYIETKDKIIRHFSIANPPSIVIDFRGASDFASQRKRLSTKPFTKLQMGAHGKRYRVVLRLDKMHQYKIDKRKYGQVVTIIK